MIDTLSHEEFTKAVVTLWAVWSDRRKAIYEEIFQSPLTIFGFIISFLAELDIAHSIKPKRQTARTTLMASAWNAPPNGFVKVNVDAAVTKHGNRGVVAAICRQENDTYLWGFGTLGFRYL
jgi:hypothetical protein